MRLERDIEAAVGRKLLGWARDNNRHVLYLKLIVPGNRGYPDRMVLYENGVLFVEFKRPGEVPRKLQEYVHERLREMGHSVLVEDDVDTAVENIINVVTS